MQLVGYIIIWSCSLAVEISMMMVSLKGTIVNDKPRKQMKRLIYIKQGMHKTWKCNSLPFLFRYSSTWGHLLKWELFLAGPILPLFQALYCAQLSQEHDDGAGDLQHDSAGDPGHLHLVCLGLCRKGLAQVEKLSAKFSTFYHWYRQVKWSFIN